MPTRVKMCCLHTPAEVAGALAAGAHVLGFVSDTLGGLGILPVTEIALLVRGVPSGRETWLVTGHTDPGALAEEHAVARTSGIQLVNSLTPAARAELRRRLPNVALVQVVHVTGDGAMAAAAAAQDADALLLDSSDPASGALGATGKTHDWEQSAAIVAASGRPVWLAGGLRASNVADAIATVHPFGVDLCSHLRTDGALDPAKAEAFMVAVRG